MSSFKDLLLNPAPYMSDLRAKVEKNLGDIISQATDKICKPVVEIGDCLDVKGPYTVDDFSSGRVEVMWDNARGDSYSLECVERNNKIECYGWEVAGKVFYGAGGLFSCQGSTMETRPFPTVGEEILAEVDVVPAEAEDQPDIAGEIAQDVPEELTLVEGEEVKEEVKQDAVLEAEEAGPEPAELDAVELPPDITKVELEIIEQDTTKQEAEIAEFEQDTAIQPEAELPIEDIVVDLPQDFTTADTAVPPDVPPPDVPQPDQFVFVEFPPMGDAVDAVEEEEVEVEEVEDAVADADAGGDDEPDMGAVEGVKEEAEEDVSYKDASPLSETEYPPMSYAGRVFGVTVSDTCHVKYPDLVTQCALAASPDNDLDAAWLFNEVNSILNTSFLEAIIAKADIKEEPKAFDNKLKTIIPGLSEETYLSLAILPLESGETVGDEIDIPIMSCTRLWDTSKPDSPVQIDDTAVCDFEDPINPIGSFIVDRTLIGLEKDEETGELKAIYGDYTSMIDALVKIGGDMCHLQLRDPIPAMSAAYEDEQCLEVIE